MTWVARKWLIPLLVGCGVVALLPAGCSQKTRSMFFDGVDSGPPPPTSRVRQNLTREVSRLERELAHTKVALEAAKKAPSGEDGREPLPIEGAKAWPEAAELLPKTEHGRVDWGEALRDGTIEPRHGLEPSSPRQAVLDFNVKIARAGSGGFAVTYSHEQHTTWLTCDSCHPAIFPLDRDAPRPVITMKKIREGQYCGACHGKVAFSVEYACNRCHQSMPSQADWKPAGPPRAPIERVDSWNAAARLLPVKSGAPDWSKALDDGVVKPRAGLDEETPDQAVLPLDIELIPVGIAAFKAVFPHQAHTKWLACNNCHIGIFQMKRGATPITMQKINEGEYCGVCHGTVAFPVEDACARCHTGFPGSPEWQPQEPPRAPIERVANWEAAAEILPVKGAATDWSKALEDGVINPRPGLDDTAKDQPVMPLNVELVPEGSAAFKVVFPHQAHTKLLSCNNCHTEIFQMKKGANPITMKKIYDGEYCGVCHGKVAFPVQDACTRCHTGIPTPAEWQPAGPPRAPIERVTNWDAAAELLPVSRGAPDWSKALEDGVIKPRPGLEADAKDQQTWLIDVELVPEGSAAFKAVFPHLAHTKLLSCTNCHIDIFQMKKGASEITMQKIYDGEYCGVCHGKVAFAVDDACTRCHTGIPAPAEWQPAGPPRAPIEQAASWAAAEALLPVKLGAPDWSKALEDGVIKPRPGLDDAAKDQPVMPIDVELVPEGSAAFKAVFPHLAHTKLLSCTSCHVGIFQMKKGASEITMEKIYAGEYCGVCHGKVAFAVEDACSRCHTGVPAPTAWQPAGPPRAPIEQAASWAAAAELLPVTLGTPDWSRALEEGVVNPRNGLDDAAPAQTVMPLNVEMIPEGNPTFKVLFPHEAHTKWLTCTSCHTDIFQMTKGANPMTMAQINAGEYCGVCHGKVAFPLTTCGRCHAALAGG